MKEHLSIERLWWLLRADLFNGYRSVLTVSGALAGVIVIASLLSIDGPNTAQGLYLSWFGAVLYIWGVIASSRVFRELHDKTRNEAYLLIPASAIEKTVARLRGVTIGLTVYLLVFFGAISLVVEILYRLFVGASAGLFNPLDPPVWGLVAGYFFVQSFYFLGAAWFQKRHFIKTTLAITLVGAGLAAFSLVTLRVVFAPGGFGDLGIAMIPWVGTVQGPLRSLEALRTFFAIVLPVTCWCIAWLRVRETQVSDGV